MRKDSQRRWEEGPRPLFFGDVWDAMKPAERRRAFRWDIAIGFGGAGIIMLCISLIS